MYRYYYFNTCTNILNAQAFNHFVNLYDKQTESLLLPIITNNTFTI